MHSWAGEKWNYGPVAAWQLEEREKEAEKGKEDEVEQKNKSNLSSSQSVLCANAKLSRLQAERLDDQALSPT